MAGPSAPRLASRAKVSTEQDILGFGVRGNGALISLESEGPRLLRPDHQRAAGTGGSRRSGEHPRSECWVAAAAEVLSGTRRILPPTHWVQQYRCILAKQHLCSLAARH